MLFVYERRVWKYEIRILTNALGGTVLQSKEASSVSPGINSGVFFFSSLHRSRMPLSQPWVFLAVLRFCCCGSQPSNGYSSLPPSFLSVNHFFEQRSGVPGNGVEGIKTQVQDFCFMFLPLWCFPVRSPFSDSGYQCLFTKIRHSVCAECPQLPTWHCQSCSYPSGSGK